jgi:thioredoxin reductase
VLYGLEIDENNISLFIKIRTKENKIIVNKNQQTNLKNFYAAGDCCWGKKEYKIASGFLEIDKIIEQIK